MAVVSPTPITALPTPPVLSDLSTFSARTDAFINALPTFRTENNNLASNVYNNAIDAATNATSAANSAINAATQAGLAAASAGVAGAIAWVSGTTYAIGDLRYSLATLQTYRRVTNGAGTVDPASDSVNWVPASIVPSAPMIYMYSLFGAL